MIQNLIWLCSSVHVSINCVSCVLGSSFSYEDEGRPARGSKAAIPPPMFDDSERPRSPPGPTSSFLANMGWVGHTNTPGHSNFLCYNFNRSLVESAKTPTVSHNHLNCVTLTLNVHLKAVCLGMYVLYVTSLPFKVNGLTHFLQCIIINYLKH